MTFYLVLVFLLASLVWLAPLLTDPTGVVFWRGGEFSDLLVSHWPNAMFLRRSLVEWQQVPLWNPTILSGAPFAADPLSGLWYPPNWLAVLLNPGVAFNVLAWLHIAWAGLGMWKLARALGMDNGPALIAGLAFGGTPKIIGHIGLGHISLVSAVYWTPWLLLAIESALRQHSATGARRLGSPALAGAASGLIFLVDPRWYLPALLLGAAFAVWRITHTHNVWVRRSEGWRGLLPLLTSTVAASAMSLAIAAALALPLAEYLPLTTRARLVPEEAAELALPVSKLLGLFASEIAGWPEWQVYAGVVVLFLAIVALVSTAAGRWFWGGMAAFAIILSLGSATPIYELVSRLVPGFSQLRVPPRSLFATAFAFSVLAGLGLQQLLDGSISLRRVRMVGFGLAASSLGLALASWVTGDKGVEATARSATFLISAALVGMSTVWAGTQARDRTRTWLPVAGWSALILLDLGLVNIATIEVRSTPTSSAPGAGALTQTGGLTRAFSPSYSLPQPTAADSGIELADGVNPLQLETYRNYMAEATGFVSEPYSVTLPPFPSGDPDEPWGFDPHLDQMGLLAISHIASAYPVQAEGLELVHTEQELYFYRNPRAMPRAWVKGSGEVLSFEWTPNQIRVAVDGPGTLILSEPQYPGWEVTIDDVPSISQTYEGLLRATEIPSGRHEVRFTFRPLTVYAGLLITLTGLLVLISLWIRR